MDNFNSFWNGFEVEEEIQKEAHDRGKRQFMEPPADGLGDKETRMPGEMGIPFRKPYDWEDNTLVNDEGTKPDEGVRVTEFHEHPENHLELHPNIESHIAMMKWSTTPDQKVVNRHGEVMFDPECEDCQRRNESGDLHGWWHTGPMGGRHTDADRSGFSGD